MKTKPEHPWHSSGQCNDAHVYESDRDSLSDADNQSGRFPDCSAPSTGRETPARNEKGITGTKDADARVCFLLGFGFPVLLCLLLVSATTRSPPASPIASGILEGPVFKEDSNDSAVKDSKIVGFLDLATEALKNGQSCGSCANRIVASMRSQPLDPTIQQQGCQILRYLSGYQNQSNETIHAGGIEVVMAAMQNHKTEPFLQEDAIRLLGSLASMVDADDRATMDFLSLVGVHEIIRAMDLYPRNVALQHVGCFALAEISVRSDEHYSQGNMASTFRVIQRARMNERGQLIGTLPSKCAQAESVLASRAKEKPPLCHLFFTFLDSCSKKLGVRVTQGMKEASKGANQIFSVSRLWFASVSQISFQQYCYKHFHALAHSMIQLWHLLCHHKQKLHLSLSKFARKFVRNAKRWKTKAIRKTTKMLSCARRCYSGGPWVHCPLCCSKHWHSLVEVMNRIRHFFLWYEDDLWYWFCVAVFLILVLR